MPNEIDEQHVRLRDRQMMTIMAVELLVFTACQVSRSGRIRWAADAELRIVCVNRRKLGDRRRPHDDRQQDDDEDLCLKCYWFFSRSWTL